MWRSPHWMARAGAVLCFVAAALLYAVATTAGPGDAAALGRVTAGGWSAVGCGALALVGRALLRRRPGLAGGLLLAATIGAFVAVGLLALLPAPFLLVAAFQAWTRGPEPPTDPAVR